MDITGYNPLSCSVTELNIGCVLSDKKGTGTILLEKHNNNRIIAAGGVFGMSGDRGSASNGSIAHRLLRHIRPQLDGSDVAARTEHTSGARP